MTIDGILCSVIAYELNLSLSGGRVDKVFQPSLDTIVLHIRTNAGVKHLIISVNCGHARIGLTDNPPENPAMPPSFCMLLRKYISGARIESVSNPGYERIIEISLSNTDELKDRKTYTLTTELMGRFSNIILINPGGKIIDSAIHVDSQMSRVREVMPARIYEYPPVQDKMTIDQALDLSRDRLLPISNEEVARPIDKALVNSILGLSPMMAKQLIGQCDIDIRSNAKLLTDDNISNLCKVLSDYFKTIINKEYKPRLYFRDDKTPAEIALVPLSGFASHKEYRSVSEVFDACYDSYTVSKSLNDSKKALLSNVDSALSRLSKKYEAHKQDLEEGKRSEKYRMYGDLILTSVHSIEQGAKSAVLPDYTDLDADGNPKQIEISLNPALSATDNANDYYKRYRKAKRKLQLSEDYIKDDEESIQYLRSLRAAILAADTDADIKALKEEIRQDSKPEKKETTSSGDPNRMVGKAKSGKASSRALRQAAQLAAARNNRKKQGKSEPLPFRRYMTDDGYEILCGRNNIQNDRLTFSVASPDDYWFHVKGIPGTHVIVKSHPGEEFPSDAAVTKAASIAAYFSKSILLEQHQASDMKCDVDYCKVSHIKKIPGAKPGMVIYEGYYSITVTAEAPGEDLNAQ